MVAQNWSTTKVQMLSNAYIDHWFAQVCFGCVFFKFLVYLKHLLQLTQTNYLYVKLEILLIWFWYVVYNLTPIFGWVVAILQSCVFIMEIVSVLAE